GRRLIILPGTFLYRDASIAPSGADRRFILQSEACLCALRWACTQEIAPYDATCPFFYANIAWESAKPMPLVATRPRFCATAQANALPKPQPRRLPVADSGLAALRMKNAASIVLVARHQRVRRRGG